MRTIRFTIGLAVVAICALGALAAPAFAKEKIVFGEFQASVTGKNLETEPVPLGIFHEDQPTPSIEGLQIGPYKFGPIIRSGPEAGKVDTSHPCKVAPKLAGKFQAEPGKVNKSDSLLITLKFRKASLQPMAARARKTLAGTRRRRYCDGCGHRLPPT